MVKPASRPVPLDEQLCYAIYSANIAIQRLYKPLLDGLGVTYPQYLVLNVLWDCDGQPVGRIAEALALESSTLTPVLKRLEAAGLLTRSRNPENERQVVIALTPKGRAMRSDAGCLGDTLLAASGETADALGALNQRIRQLGTALYNQIDEWKHIAGEKSSKSE